MNPTGSDEATLKSKSLAHRLSKLLGGRPVYLSYSISAMTAVEEDLLCLPDLETKLFQYLKANNQNTDTNHWYGMSIQFLDENFVRKIRKIPKPANSNSENFCKKFVKLKGILHFHDFHEFFLFCYLEIFLLNSWPMINSLEHPADWIFEMNGHLFQVYTS